MQTPKRPYIAPVLAPEGTLKDLTLGESTGKFLDKAFPVLTPFTQLTFTN